MNDYLFKDYNHLLHDTRFKIKVKGKTYNVYIAVTDKSIGVLTKDKNFDNIYYKDINDFSKYTIREFIDFIKTLIKEVVAPEIENRITNEKTDKQIRKEILKDNKLKDGKLDGVNKHTFAMSMLKQKLNSYDKGDK